MRPCRLFILVPGCQRGVAQLEKRLATLSHDHQIQGTTRHAPRGGPRDMHFVFLGAAGCICWGCGPDALGAGRCSSPSATCSGSPHCLRSLSFVPVSIRRLNCIQWLEFQLSRACGCLQRDTIVGQADMCVTKRRNGRPVDPSRNESRKPSKAHTQTGSFATVGYAKVQTPQRIISYGTL